MNSIDPGSLPPPTDSRLPSPEQTLRKLFLTLFLRGRSARGLQKQKVPKSIAQKLAATLTFYALFGLLALTLLRQPIFALSAYLHAMTFVFLGMFVASSAGEILFNKEEADILLHRPIAPRALLWAKVRVLVEVSLWMAAAFNLAGLFVGVAAPNGDWRFPIVHVFSMALEAIFCTGCVILVYQLCLRWWGRERLEGLMTTAQVIVSMAAVLSGQILPQLLFRFNNVIGAEVPWWIGLLPPAWFAGIDDALAGSGAPSSWFLAGLAVIGTALVVWIAFGKLAHDYETGLQALQETVSAGARERNRGRRWLEALIDRPPLRWWLGEPVVRASFLLSAAYLFRDRDVKLRIYPALAPILIMPIVLLRRQGPGGSGGFGIAFVGGYLGLISLLAVGILQYSQQWQAADIFRMAPLAGPAPLCHGARRAILCVLTLPLLVLAAVIIGLLQSDRAQLLLLLPGVIALPVYALIPNLGGKAVPLSLPTDESKSAGRGLMMVGVILLTTVMAGLAAWSWSAGYFWWLILIESLVVLGLRGWMCQSIAAAVWPVLE